MCREKQPEKIGRYFETPPTVSSGDRWRRNKTSVVVSGYEVQSNLFNTDTKGTEPSVRFTEVSVLQRQGMYDFWLFWDQTNSRNREVSVTRGQTVHYGTCGRFQTITYHEQIILLFVYTTIRKRFVIFTCRYFKLS